MCGPKCLLCLDVQNGTISSIDFFLNFYYISLFRLPHGFLGLVSQSDIRVLDNFDHSLYFSFFLIKACVNFIPYPNFSQLILFLLLSLLPLSTLSHSYGPRFCALKNLGLILSKQTYLQRYIVLKKIYILCFSLNFIYFFTENFLHTYNIFCQVHSHRYFLYNFSLIPTTTYASQLHLLSVSLTQRQLYIHVCKNLLIHEVIIASLKKMYSSTCMIDRDVVHIKLK